MTEEQTSDEVEGTQDAERTTTAAADEPIDEADQRGDEPVAEPFVPKRRVNGSRVLAFGVLPAIALVLAIAAGYLKWQDNSVREGDAAGVQAVQAAKDNTVAILSYKADTVEQQLNTAARDLLTGEFRGSYEMLIDKVVIPGAKEKQVSAAASVTSAAPVSAQPNHAVVLVFIDQSVTIASEPPTKTASSVRVTLDKVGDRWLISQFQPV